MTDRDQIVARARGCVGARFRPYGRDPALGLDCVGVAAIAFGRTEIAAYALRSADVRAADAALVKAGLRRIATAEAGDLALLQAAPTQLHLAVLTDIGFVHADTGLGRIVETPGRPDGLLSAWREES